MNRKITPWIFLSLPLFLYLVFVLGPTIASFYLSFTDMGISSRANFVGLKNYIKLFCDPIFYQALRNNVIWVVCSLSIPTLLGLLISLMIARKIKGRRLFTSVFYFPMILSLVAVGIIWSWIYNPALGILNTLLDATGLTFLTRNWLGNPDIVLYSIMIGAFWQQTGFCMILFFAGLRNISPALTEAAEIDGASDWQRLLYVTLPLLRGTTTVVIIMTAVGALKVFDLIFTMTQGGPFYSSEVLSLYMYSESFIKLRYGYGAAIAVVQFLIVLPFIIVYMKRMIATEITY